MEEKVIYQENKEIKIISDGSSFLINLKDMNKDNNCEILISDELFYKILAVLNNPKTRSASTIDKLQEIKLNFHKAYEKWTHTEELKLISLFTSKKTINYISNELQRQPSAIESRLRKLGYL